MAVALCSNTFTLKNYYKFIITSVCYMSQKSISRTNVLLCQIKTSLKIIIMPSMFKIPSQNEDIEEFCHVSAVVNTSRHQTEREKQIRTEARGNNV